MTTSPPPNLEGTVVGGRYRVEHLLGMGGMGSVWAGRHETLGQAVAIKFVHPKLAGSKEARRRFEIEAKAAARINSRHAVKVQDHGVSDDGYPYIVMEYLEGHTLEHAIRERGALPLIEVATIVTQVARALEAAHDAGIVHRDLKPDNIFLAVDPEAGRLGYTVKVVDFGIAKLVHEDAKVGGGGTQAGALLGTPHYMSPEALTMSSPVERTSDVWSLGACAFAAVCGRPPFEGDVIGEVVLKVCSAPMPVPSRVNQNVPPAFDAWFARCCSRLPTNRFQTARDAAVALQQLDQWTASEREAQSFAVRPQQPSRLELELMELQPKSRGRTLAVVLVLAALGIAAAGFYMAKSARDANLAFSQPEVPVTDADAGATAEAGPEATPSALPPSSASASPQR